MKKLLMITAFLILAGCGEEETAAERTAKAYKVCHDAGLKGVVGESMIGALIIYCEPKETKGSK